MKQRTSWSSDSDNDSDSEFDEDDDALSNTSDSYASDEYDDGDTRSNMQNRTHRGQRARDDESKQGEDQVLYSAIERYGRTSEELVAEFHAKELASRERHRARIYNDAKSLEFLRLVAPRPLSLNFDLLARAVGRNMPAHNIPPMAPLARDPFVEPDPFAFGGEIELLPSLRAEGISFLWKANVTARFDSMLRNVCCEALANCLPNLVVHYNPQGFKCATTSLMLDNLPASCKACFKLFESGKCAITGARTIEQAYQAAHVYCLYLRRCGIMCGVHNMEINNILGVSDFGFQLDIESIHNYMPDSVKKYKRFPAVGYKEQRNGPSALMFASGKCVYAGNRTEDDVRDMHIRMSRVARMFDTNKGILAYKNQSANNRTAKFRNIDELTRAVESLGKNRETLQLTVPLYDETPNFTAEESAAVAHMLGQLQLTNEAAAACLTNGPNDNAWSTGLVAHSAAGYLASKMEVNDAMSTGVEQSDTDDRFDAQMDWS